MASFATPVPEESWNQVSSYQHFKEKLGEVGEEDTTPRVRG
jgi:hypothetical protein